MLEDKQMLEPPLLRFTRSLGRDGLEAFANAAGTTRGYLKQMTCSARPNPALRLAFALEAESHRLHRLGVTKAPPITLEDLLVGRILAKRVRDHTTGELFALLPSGEMVRRRIDKQKRLVLVGKDNEILGVEEEFPGPITIRRTPKMEDA